MKTTFLFHRGKPMSFSRTEAQLVVDESMVRLQVIKNGRSSYGDQVSFSKGSVAAVLIQLDERYIATEDLWESLLHKLTERDLYLTVSPDGRGAKIVCWNPYGTDEQGKAHMVFEASADSFRTAVEKALAACG